MGKDSGRGHLDRVERDLKGVGVMADMEGEKELERREIG